MPDEYAAAKVLCAMYGDVEWHRMHDKAKDRFRYEAREIAEAYEEQSTEGHMPLFHGLGIAFDQSKGVPGPVLVATAPAPPLSEEEPRA